MSEDDIAQNATPLDIDETQPEYALSTPILDLVQNNAVTLVEEYPNDSIASIIYTLVLTIIRSPQLRKTNGTMVPDILVYYLESYKRFRHNQEPDKDPTQFLNEAGLTLFDLYCEDPHNQTKRKLVELIAGSIRDHWLDRVIKDETIEGNDEFMIVNNLTIITNTISKYTARPRRDKNLTYIAWIRVILTKLFNEGDGRFLLDAPDVKAVIDQITKGHKTILITKH